MQRTGRFSLPLLFGALCGALLLMALSTLQKYLINFPIRPEGFVIPFFMGGTGGYLLTLWNIRLHRQNTNLESRVRERTQELLSLNTKLHASNQRYSEMFENMGSGVAVLRPENKSRRFIFREFNSAAERIENLSRENVINREIREIFPGIKDTGLIEALQRVHATGKSEFLPAAPYSDERNHSWREIHVYKLPGNEIVCIYNDITDRKQMEDDLERMANTDFLTGIPNRRSFMETLELEMNRVRRYKRPLSLLMFDLDYFKTVNDCYGHETGDTVLQQVTKTCTNLLREVDRIGRLGGEEFAVLLPETPLAGAMEVAERIRQQIQNLTIPTDNSDISVTVSIGAAEHNKHATTPNTILSAADKALYMAKQTGRNKTIAAPNTALTIEC